MSQEIRAHEGEYVIGAESLSPEHTERLTKKFLDLQERTRTAKLKEVKAEKGLVEQDGLFEVEEVMKHVDFFDRLGGSIHITNVEKGFWEEPEMMDKYVAKLALIHSEVTEVLEALRKNQGTDKVTEEFADILIRTFDLYSTLVEAGEADPELFEVMKKKMEANEKRPPKHSHRWG